ncbi:phage fiber-tail adaptor protein [Mycobacteroides abscessus]|uniref:phage fiber-tail adaptor protein n=1 Tax=Mycobacteroides abscessus TaxID=36809 RepID=UPI0009A6870C|nr:hypothetical protein [Mycobacteroides abscessus]SKS40582.1 Uncharacterised protein [Mycobacteroides abscessus subsp. bolletii]
MALKKFVKDPHAVLDYTLDWSAWLAPGDTLVSATATATTGLTVDQTANTTTEATVWLSGGGAGTTYDVTVHVTTAGGRQDDRTIQIQCKEL